ncbi:hypothetical protein BT67DRAFT_449958 [Trichocladium antarcticum]|uniref:Uncharacterized protein n=1 Tax=Trichocladium antarcticum TaxID=1450529 RepID=A0AAN6ZCC8_9PEZI|nr:hypothetical protein BT67DRAFT_449958 [Trichocladium antarcticum]
MAVMTLRRLAAVAVWLPAVSAGLEREKPNPWAPIETPGPKPEAEINLAPAAVTARPAMRALIQKRNENTCGYMAGDLTAGYVCAASSAVCLYNTQSSAVGCCLPTGCNIYTACLPYESSDATKTLDMDRTRYCSDSTKPFCAPLSFTDPTFTGYTIPSCDSVATTRVISYSQSEDETTTSKPRSSLQITSVSSTSSPSPESSDESSAASSDSSTPVGPIVGGVVGGVALIALIALGALFLLRKKKQNDAPLPPPGPPAAPGFSPPAANPAYPNQMQSPDMSSTAGGAAGGFYDPRYSMAKPPMATQADPMQPPPMSPPFSVSPSQSPPPVYNSAAQQYGNTPPPHQQYGHTPPPQQQQQQYGQPMPPQQQHAPYGYQGQPAQPHHHVAELPTQRGDGQLYEAP